MKNNKTKNYIICGVIVLAIIAVLIAGFFLLKEDNNTPNVNGPTNDFVNNGGNTGHPNQNDREVNVGDFLYVMLEANDADRQAAIMLEPWFTADEITKSYSNIIGTKFLDEYSIASTYSGKVTIPNNTKRIFLFNTYDDSKINSYIDKYLLLSARAEDAGLYQIYVVNTNLDTMEEFIAKDLGYVQNNPTEESIKFFETLPDNFLLYVNEDNVIQFVSSVNNAYSTAEIAAYVFGTEIPCHEILTLIRDYVFNYDYVYQTYLQKMSYKELYQVESIAKLNSERGYDFNILESLQLFKMFGANINASSINIADEVLRFVGTDVDDPGIGYEIYQTYSSKKELIDISMYEYFNTVGELNQTIKIYGNNKEDIKVVKFQKNNICVAIAVFGRGLTISEVETIVENF